MIHCAKGTGTCSYLELCRRLRPGEAEVLAGRVAKLRQTPLGPDGVHLVGEVQQGVLWNDLGQQQLLDPVLLPVGAKWPVCKHWGCVTVIGFIMG